MGGRFLVSDRVCVVGLWLLGLWWLWYGWLGLCGGYVSDEFVVIVVWVVGFWYMVGLWLSYDMEFFFWDDGFIAMGCGDWFCWWWLL